MARAAGAGVTTFRIDISRPEFTRGQLDGAADLWVVAGEGLRTGDALALFISDGDAIRVSRRVHAYLRAEQDLAYVHLLATRSGLNRAQIQALIAANLDLRGATRKHNEADAGAADYATNDPLAAHHLREGLAALITAR